MLILGLYTLTLLYSCGEGVPAVTFNEPQPAGSESMDKFPDKLQGEYQNKEDISKITITDKIILQSYTIDFKIPKSEIDSMIKASGDSAFKKKEGLKNLSQEGDSIIFPISKIDTLFDINKGDVLKKFKGYYFLNKNYNDFGWGVQKLHLSKGDLMISKISSQEALDGLTEIKESKDDTGITIITNRKFSATKKQFKKFVKEDGFKDQDTFIRIRGK